MASYTCAIRTNYFHVKDEAVFRAFADKICCNEEAVEVWEDKDKAGNAVFGFGCCSSLTGILSDSDSTEEPDAAYDRLIKGLQEHIREDDAVIIFESGREKLNYVSGLATVITANECRYLDISDFAVAQARKMLNNEAWETKASY